MPTNNLSLKSSNSYTIPTFKKWALAIIALGVFLRLIDFFYNRSLWCDEGLLSINLLHRNFAGLLKPLDAGQVAPILFLWAEKLMMEIFGNNDLSLRTLPLLISLPCLYLFYKISTKLLGQGAVTLFVLFLYASSIFLLRYASEVKQYQGDMLVALFFWWQLLRTDDYGKLPFVVTMLLAGCVAVWFSNTAVVVLFVAGAYVVYAQAKSTKKIPFVWVFTCCLWMASFAIYFLLFINHHPLEGFMLSFWAKNFPPHNIFSASFIKWAALSYLNLASAIVPFASKYNIYLYLFVLFLAAGMVYVVKQRNIKLIFILILPLLLHFILAWLKKYPIVDKFLIYQFPAFYILAAMGAKAILAMLPNGKKLSIFVKYAFGTTIIATCCLDIFINYPVQVEEIKKSISYINKNIQPGQQVYVYGKCRVVFNFYKETGVTAFTNNIIYGEKHRNDIQKYNDDLAAIKGNIWFLFAHYNTREKEVIINYLSKNGTLLNSYSAKGSNCYLYNINK